MFHRLYIATVFPRAEDAGGGVPFCCIGYCGPAEASFFVPCPFRRARLCGRALTFIFAVSFLFCASPSAEEAVID